MKQDRYTAPATSQERIGKGRLEAFSDGVIAIIVTIMVLELKVPRDATLASLIPVTPVFLSYFLSFLVVAVMWVNHHHMIHSVKEVNGSLLWLNMNLLFWMSLIPFSTAWLGNHYLDPLPVALYGLNLALSGGAFCLLRGELQRQYRDDEKMSVHHARIQRKSILSFLLYLLSVGAAWISVYISEAIFVIIPLLYFLPENLAGEDD